MKIFLSKDVFEEVMIWKDKYPNLSTIFSSNSQIIFDMSDVELDALLSDSEDDFTQIISGNDISHEAKKGILEYYKEHIEEMLHEPRALFFMDVDKEQAKAFRKDYGMMVLSINDYDDLAFEHPIFQKRLIKGNLLQGSVHEGWKKVLDKIQVFPMNTLVISDSYLFANPDIDDSVRNIQGVLDVILPQEFKDTFHVLFFTSEMSKSKGIIDKAIGDIKTYITSKRPYKIILEYVLYKSLHQRKIISNYDTIIFDKGLVAFKTVGKKQIKTIDANYIQCLSIYDRAVCSVGMSGYDIVSQDLLELKKLYEDCRDICNSANPDSNKRILGTNNKDKSLNNRLINSV